MLALVIRIKMIEREPKDGEAKAAAPSSCFVNSLVMGQNFVFTDTVDSMDSASADLKEKWVLIASIVLLINYDLNIWSFMRHYSK